MTDQQMSTHVMVRTGIDAFAIEFLSTQLEETGAGQVEYEVYSGQAKMAIHRQ